MAQTTEAVVASLLESFARGERREAPYRHWFVAACLPEKAVDLRPLDADELCYIQFSSGSTRHPHGVQITQRALMANLAGITGPRVEN